MVLNYIWIGFLLIAVVVALIQTFVFGDTAVLTAVMDSMFGSAKTGFEISYKPLRAMPSFEFSKQPPMRAIPERPKKPKQKKIAHPDRTLIETMPATKAPIPAPIQWKLGK